MRTRIALGFSAPVTTAQTGGPVLLRTHLHRVAQGDGGATVAQAIVVTLAAVAVVAWLVSRFFASPFS